MSETNALPTPDSVRGLLPRTSVDTDDDVARVLAKLEAVGGDNLVTKLLANSPNGFRPYVLMSNALLNRAALGGRARELAILALAADNAVAYEWWEHISMSDAAGVTDAERARIADGDTEAGFTDSERLAMRLAVGLRAGGAVSDEDWTAAEQAWGQQGVLDLVLVTAWWGGFMPMVIAALRLDDLVIDAIDLPTRFR